MANDAFWFRLKKKMTWEFFPAWLVYTPVVGYYFYLAARARSLTFPLASNPGIHNAGFFGESKYDILRQVIPPFLPKTHCFEQEVKTAAILGQMQAMNLNFPIILKPDRGERGNGVAKIYNEAEVSSYLKEIAEFPLLLQEYVGMKEEYGVTYYRIPGESQGHVISIVKKDFLSVTGDGHSTLHELVKTSDRCQFHYDTIVQNHSDSFEEVIPAGQKKVLSEIGNHCKGTTFLNANDLITPELHKAFEPLVDQLDGFYIGRFDLRAPSIEELRKGNYRIMEINGVASEPGHIYHPGFPIWKAYRDLLSYWHKVYLVGVANQKRGVQTSTVKTFVGEFREYLKS